MTLEIFCDLVDPEIYISFPSEVYREEYQYC